MNQELLRFRRLAPVHEAEIADVTWRYRGFGNGPALLALPGAIGDGEVSFPVLLALAQGRRVLSIAYPRLSTIRTLVDGLTELLDREGMDRVDVMGGSYGGLVGQVLARLHPRRVRSLVLSHTGVPRPSRARTNRRVIRVLNGLPQPAIHWLMRRIIAVVVKPTGDSCRFWYELCASAVNVATKEDVIAIYERSVDLDSRRRGNRFGISEDGKQVNHARVAVTFGSKIVGKRSHG